ncbi:MAG: ParB/RepB/Spo0J family partition protein [Bacillota bacterium]
MSKKGLGRGLGALIPEVEVHERDHDSIQELDLREVQPNPHQPRKEFDQARLDELAASIREHGIVQPIVVRPKGKGYEIVAGERRWRAAGLAGLKKIPALVREFSEAETMEIALIENLQREDLNPLEEAEAYKVLMESFKLTQEELAQRLGKSRPQIANTLRLLQLAPVAREAVRSGRLSMGHAKVLLGLGDAEQQSALASRVVAEGLSVRQVEDLARAVAAKQKVERTPSKEQMSPDLLEVEARLREWFGTPVKLNLNGEKGRIEITFFGEDGLGRILDALGLGEGPGPTPPKERFRV